MTLRHGKFAGEADKILLLESTECHTPANAIDRIKRMLRTAQALWPDELEGYKIVQRKRRK